MATLEKQNFVELAEKSLSDLFNFSMTENGGLGYATTGKELLDMNFKLSSYRSMSDNDIKRDFFKAMVDDPMLALKFLFYARDVRGGAGERRFFRVIMAEIGRREPMLAMALLPIIAEYGRYDDILCLYGLSEDLNKGLDAYIYNTLMQDYRNAQQKKPATLLAKWLPSVSTGDFHKKQIAIRLSNKLFSGQPLMYQRFLSYLRGYLDIVERKMSNNEWDKIDYAKVPSMANLLYNKAFFKHDKERREAFIESLQKGEAKINASVAFPHDIVGKMVIGRRLVKPSPETAALEEMWKALPRYTELGSTLVVQDGSGSMTGEIGRTSTTALQVAVALAIYFAETCEGPYKNKYITFSERPRFINVQHCTDLYNKVQTAMAYSEIANTDIDAVFELILVTACQNGLTQEQMPKRVLIISDMEFDYCAINARQRNFDSLRDRFKAQGYDLPALVFWNVMSRTGTIPMTQNDRGVTLVSGFSPSAIKMVMTGKTDPYDALVELINGPRYMPVEAAVMAYKEDATK